MDKLSWSCQVIELKFEHSVTNYFCYPKLIITKVDFSFSSDQDNDWFICFQMVIPSISNGDILYLMVTQTNGDTFGLK